MIIASDNLRLNTETRTLSHKYHAKEVRIPSREANILACLMKYTNKLVTLNMLFDQADIPADVSLNSLHVAMSRIRHALSAWGLDHLVTNVRGDGWIYRASSEIKQVYALSSLQMGALKAILATAAPMHAERVKIVREALVT